MATSEKRIRVITTYNLKEEDMEEDIAMVASGEGEISQEHKRVV